MHQRGMSHFNIYVIFLLQLNLGQVQDRLLYKKLIQKPKEEEIPTQTHITRIND